MKTEKSFTIKTYAFCELALLIMPVSSKKTASQALRKWLNFNAKLNKSLIEAGWNKGRIAVVASQTGRTNNLFSGNSIIS